MPVVLATPWSSIRLATKGYPPPPPKCNWSQRKENGDHQRLVANAIFHSRPFFWSLEPLYYGCNCSLSRECECYCDLEALVVNSLDLSQPHFGRHRNSIMVAGYLSGRKDFIFLRPITTKYLVANNCTCTTRRLVANKGTLTTKLLVASSRKRVNIYDQELGPLSYINWLLRYLVAHKWTLTTDVLVTYQILISYLVPGRIQNEHLLLSSRSPIYLICGHA